MNRRAFLRCSGTCVGAGVIGVPLAASAVAAQAQPPQAPQQPPEAGPPAAKPDAAVQQPRRRQYDFTVEIVEGKCGPHQAGQTFKYPDEKGKICPWLKIGRAHV